MSALEQRLGALAGNRRLEELLHELPRLGDCNLSLERLELASELAGRGHQVEDVALDAPGPAVADGGAHFGIGARNGRVDDHLDHLVLGFRHHPHFFNSLLVIARGYRLPGGAQAAARRVFP